MTVRIQMRRGTTSQWNTADPVLNSGEIGYNETLGAFKIGDGSTAWSLLDYYQTTAEITPSDVGAIALTEKNAANGVATLDSNKDVITASKLIFEGATADAYEAYLQLGGEPIADITFTLPTTSGVILTADTSGNVIITGDLTVNGTTTTIDTQNLQVEDKNITLGYGSTSDAAVDGGGITLTGATNKTLNWVDATDAWTSSEHINLASGKNYLKNGTDIKDVTETLTNKTISGSSNTITNIGNESLTNSSITINGSSVSLGGSVSITGLPSQTGNNGKYLTTDGSNASWATIAADIEGVTAGTGLTGGGTSGTVTLNVDTTVVATTNNTVTLSNKTISGTSNTITNVANSSLTNSTISGVALGSNLNALTIGTGLSGTSYNGSTSVTVAIDSTVATTSGVQTLTNKTLGTGTALSADLSAATYKITSLGTPSASTDAATKQYVDDIAQGLHIHASCVAATTANINLNTQLENNDILDGVTLATGNRVLVKNQTATADNGIYIVQANGAAVRATDFDTPAEIHGGDFVFVTGGTVNDNTGWVQTETVTTVGTSPILFQQFSGAGTYQAGNGLTLTGNTFSINTTITADTSSTQTLTNKTISLGSNTISGTIAQFNTALTDGDFATLAGTETLTGKTINGANNTLTVRLANDISGFGTGVATALGVNTGSAGAVVLFNGALGTPSSGTLTNATGLPVTSGISGMGTGIATFLATPSSANLASAITDETGSGALVFGTSPSFTTSITLNATGELRLADTDSSHYVGFKSPGTVTTNKIWTLPSADGTSGQTLSTNGSGTLSWSTPAAGAAFSELLLVGC